MSSLPVRKRENTLRGALWLITFGVPVIILLLPLQIDPVLQRYFAITLWGLLSWITVIIPVEATGLTIPILYMFCGIVPAEIAFASWQNAMVWNTIAIILVGTACDKTGISKRMAYSVLLKMNCSLRGLIWGFAAVGMLLAFLISDSFSRMIIFVTIAIVFTLTESFTRMAMSAGIDPVPVMYALNFATDIYIFPYEFAIFLVCFSFGLIAYKDLIKVMLWRVACGFGIFLVICVPLWKLCGLM